MTISGRADDPSGRVDADDPNVPPPPPAPFELVAITGLSGAGTSEAVKCFEDMGYYVMDSLPPEVIEQVADLLRASGIKKGAVVVRPSGREFFEEFFTQIDASFARLREKDVRVRIIFLEASEDTIVRRYEALRRPHPLAPTERIADGIERERGLLGRLHDDAELVIDTSALTPHDLRRRLREAFPPEGATTGLQVNVTSFGYKYGLPNDADLVFDMRLLPNPHWVPELRPLVGTDERVRQYVLSQDEAQNYLDRLRDLLEFLLPGFVREGKHYLTVAIGCTGGHHRSVVFATELAKHAETLGFGVSLHHRDIDRE